jgi:hypothetical protein
VDEPDEDTETGNRESSSSDSDSDDLVIVEASEKSADEESNLQEETDEEELSKPQIHIPQMMQKNLNDIQHVYKKIGDLPFMHFFAQRLRSTTFRDGGPTTSHALRNNVKGEEEIHDL